MSMRKHCKQHESTQVVVLEKIVKGSENIQMKKCFYIFIFLIHNKYLLSFVSIFRFKRVEILEKGNRRIFAL